MTWWMWLLLILFFNNKTWWLSLIILIIGTMGNSEDEKGVSRDKGESMSCNWAEAKLNTAIKMQTDNEEKQSYYARENGYRSDSYEIELQILRENEREARAEVKRKCN
jgi:hypothetical protein